MLIFREFTIVHDFHDQVNWMSNGRISWNRFVKAHLGLLLMQRMGFDPSIITLLLLDGSKYVLFYVEKAHIKEYDLDTGSSSIRPWIPWFFLMLIKNWYCNSLQMFF